jgi:hypothetical protein
VGTLILLAPLFSELPKAVLAAIIVDAVVFGLAPVVVLAQIPSHATGNARHNPASGPLMIADAPATTRSPSFS